MNELLYETEKQNYMRSAAPNQANWSPQRPPMMICQSYPQHVMSSQSSPINSPPRFIQAAGTQPSCPIMINGTTTNAYAPGFIPNYFQRQYVSNVYYPNQIYSSPYDQPSMMDPNFNTVHTGTPANVSITGHPMSSVSLGTPAMINRTGLVLPAGIKSGPLAPSPIAAPLSATNKPPPPVEEVEDEMTPVESERHNRASLPPIPASTRPTVHECGIGHSSYQYAVGALSARIPAITESYASNLGPLTDRLGHARVLSSPAMISPRMESTTDWLTVGSFWPMFNPLIDMLKLIEVIDYRSTTTFKSLLIAVSPESTAKDLSIAFDDGYEIRLKIGESSGDTVYASSLALLKASLKEEDNITIKSNATGNSVKISVKQLLLSGLTACQGKYLLSDTEHVNFGIQLSYNSARLENGPIVCICPPHISYTIKRAESAVLSHVQDEEVCEVSNTMISTQHQHVREASADCVKNIRPLSSAKLFLANGMPMFNRLVVKIEGFEGFNDYAEIPSIFLRATLGGGAKGYRCKVDNWMEKAAHAEFDFEYRGNKTIKFSLIHSDTKQMIGATQLNLLALLALSKNQFHGSLPVNHEGQVIGRMKVGVLFTNASLVNETKFKAFSWPQALMGGSFLKIVLHELKGSLEQAHDPLFFRVSCEGVKVRSAKFSADKAESTLDLKDEVMELPITRELLSASEQKDFILCVYSRYNNETACHTASHYIKISPSIVELPCDAPRTVVMKDCIMTPASQEFACEEFMISFTFSIHN